MRSRERYNSYQRRYQLDRYRKRRAAAFAILGSKCSTCGSAENLQIDHVDPQSKDVELGKMWSIAEERYLGELVKCQLLCEAHHREKSRGEQAGDHGCGVTGKRNCRCALCAPLKDEYRKKYRGR